MLLDGRDISQSATGYSLSQRAGQHAALDLQLDPRVKDEFDCLARVLVGVASDQGPAAATFLGAIDPGELGGPHKLTRAMLLQLQEWALGGVKDGG